MCNILETFTVMYKNRKYKSPDFSSSIFYPNETHRNILYVVIYLTIAIVNNQTTKCDKNETKSLKLIEGNPLSWVIGKSFYLAVQQYYACALVRNLKAKGRCIISVFS